MVTLYILQAEAVLYFLMVVFFVLLDVLHVKLHMFFLNLFKEHFQIVINQSIVGGLNKKGPG